MKIHKQDNGKLTEADAMTVAGILLRAGYTVSVDFDQTKKQWVVRTAQEPDGQEGAIV